MPTINRRSFVAHQTVDMIPTQKRPDNCAAVVGSLFSLYWCEKDAEKDELMEFGGRYLLNAPRARVWAALNDTEILKAAIPGCHRIAWAGEAALELEIKVNFGVMHLIFAGDLSLSDIVPAEHYTLAGKGRGGLLGLAEGTAQISLDDADTGTELRFTANGGASGQIMRLGRALIGNSAQRVIDGFFERFASAMGVGIAALDPVA
jgi:carbon monoxide dehydrogenase subunit G